MRETARAKAAFNDYAAMGPERSLEKLAQEYQRRSENVPTRQLSRLQRWSVAHSWQARLAAIAEEERQAIVRRGIAEKQNRVDLLVDLAKRYQQVIEARAKDNDDLTGGETGLIVREVTYLPGGSTRERQEADVAVTKELRELAKQAAQELGEWTEKQAIDHGGKVTHDVDDDTARHIADLIAQGLKSGLQQESAQESSGA